MKKIKFNGVKIETQPDSRNYNISRFVPGEDKIDNKEFMLPIPELDVILNQHNYGACVGHSFAIAKSILEYIQSNKWIDFDPYLIYGTRYANEYTGVGMYSWQGARNLYKEGAFLRRDFNVQEEMPQLMSTVNDWKNNNNDKVQDALNYKITGYSYVYTVNDFKKALKNNMPISVSYPLYTSFYEVGNDGIVKNKGEYDNLEGYHQMTVIGWTSNNYWIVLNSWGTDVGLKGLYFIPFDYKFDNAIAISDTIIPIKKKAKHISLKINDYNYIIDGVINKLDTYPFIKKDRTYVPIRFISEALGASVEWIEATREVIIRSEEALIKMQIDNKDIIINDKIIHNDVAPIIFNDRTMLPVRIIAEALNCNVKWFPSGTINIKAK